MKPALRHPGSQSCAVAALAAAISLGALGFVPAAAAEPAETAAAALAVLAALKDQFDQPFEPAGGAGQVVLLLQADRGGSEFSGRWAEAIGRSLEAGAAPAASVRWVSVASLPAAPGFMRGFVKGKFPQDRSQPTLLDWGGRLARKLSLPADRCNVLVLAPDGRLVHRAGGREVDAAAVPAVVRAIREAANSPEAPPA